VSEALKLLEAKNYDGARRVFEEIVSRDGSNAEAHFHLGKLLASHYEEFDAAEEHLEKAIELDDKNADYHFLIGNFYGGQAQRASIFSKMSYAGKVKDQFLRAVQLAPENIRYRTALMSYYLQAPGIAGGSVSKAREQAEEIGKRDAYEGHLALGGVAEYEKEWQSAEREYGAASQASPSRWQAYHRLGYLCIRLKRPDDAIAQFRQMIRVAPDDPNSYDSMADALAAKGGDTGAELSYFLKALAINPTFSSSLYGAGRCYDELGKAREALQYYHKFLENAPRSGSDLDRAKKRVKELEGN
jgi:tetratricopeptide (TPR) repeat protein